MSNQHQMSRHSSAWGIAAGTCRVEALGVDPRQDWAAVAPNGRRLGPSLGFTGGHLTRVRLFSIHTAGGRCIGRQRRQLSVVPSRRWAATQFQRAPLGCALRLRQHRACKLVDAAKAHSQRPLCVVGFNNRDRDTEEFAIVRTAFQGSRNVFRG
jgi:hypothetical protein